ncbi:MAG TPA: LytTR family DNA-binding domain-containing protein [Chitinophagaceae bacterium]|nr:LytTR family DNA-binding domain-containing protein [Chitinophagaceae bacterium]
MKVLIIEDEPLGAESLQNLLIECDKKIEILSIRDSIVSSAAWLSTHDAPELIFMDIELADGQCFELFKEVEIKSPVIFTTSYDEYALKAFRFNSIDYLLKPISPVELKRSLDKVQNLKQQFSGIGGIQKDWGQLIHQFNAAKPLTEYRDRFLVKQGQRLLSINVSEIAYFFTKGKVSFIKSTEGKEYFLDYTLDQLQPMLLPKTFYRINRQIIASHASVLQVHTWFNGKLKVELSPPTNEEVIVSRDKAKDFRQWLGE